MIEKITIRDKCASKRTKTTLNIKNIHVYCIRTIHIFAKVSELKVLVSNEFIAKFEHVDLNCIHSVGEVNYKLLFGFEKTVLRTLKLLRNMNYDVLYNKICCGTVLYSTE